MKICFVSDFCLNDPSAIITGVMVQTHLLARTFAKRGWEVDYIASTSVELPESSEGVRYRFYPRRRFFRWLDVMRIWRRLAQSDADVYYQRGRDFFTGIIALYCRRHRKKFLWASAGETGLEKNKFRSQLARKKRNGLVKLLLLPEAWLLDTLCHEGVRKASAVIVQTETQQARLRETFHRESVVIQSGHEAPAAIERALPWKALWIGSLKAVKQPEEFLKLAELCQGMECEFLIAGQMADPVLGERIRASAARWPRVHFLGAIPFEKSGDLIASAHVLVNTTIAGYEGLPNAFVQAWLGGTAILSLSADPDGVLGRQGLGFPCATVNEMAAHLQRWIDHPEEWRRISDQARSYGKKFSIETIADQIADLIHVL